MKHAKQQGFTLIEILVVLFIISIVTSVALLSISRNENKQMETFANQLTQSLTLAEEQAMLQPSVLGFELNETRLEFDSLEINQETKKSIWVPLTDTILSRQNIPDNIAVSIDINGNTQPQEETDKHNPQIIISTNGDITPFSIYVGKKGERPRFVIRGEADGTITSKTLS